MSALRAARPPGHRRWADLPALSREAVDSPRAVRSMGGSSLQVVLQLRERWGRGGAVRTGAPRRCRGAHPHSKPHCGHPAAPSTQHPDSAQHPAPPGTPAAPHCAKSIAPMAWSPLRSEDAPSAPALGGGAGLPGPVPRDLETQAGTRTAICQAGGHAPGAALWRPLWGGCGDTGLRLTLGPDPTRTPVSTQPGTGPWAPGASYRQQGGPRGGRVVRVRLPPGEHPLQVLPHLPVEHAVEQQHAEALQGARVRNTGRGGSPEPPPGHAHLTQGPCFPRSRWGSGMWTAGPIPATALGTGSPHLMPLTHFLGSPWGGPYMATGLPGHVGFTLGAGWALTG